MTVGERFQSWLEDLSNAWKDQLRGWLLRAIGEGAAKFFEDREPEMIDVARASLTKLRNTPGITPELQAIIDKALTPGDIGTVALGWLFTLVGSLLAIMSLGQPIGRTWTYLQDRIVKSARLDPAAVITAWRRDPALYNEWFKDVLDQGYSEEQIEVLKAITTVIPNAPDIVRFAVREVYDPATAEKFGQFQDFPTAALPDAAKAGLPEDTLKKYWAAHWDLPSPQLGYEMLHRGIITAAELTMLLKALDVMPYWRPKLEAISWAVPTRVDVRRFWDMRTIDEARLREIYTALGYHGKDLDDYILWTKIYVDFPDLLARYKNGWIALDRVRAELIAMGMTPERAGTLIEEKIKKAAPERVVKEKDLTKADITGGVKKDVITRAQGVELLTELGYSRDEATYILAVAVPPDEEEKAKAARELSQADILEALGLRVITEAEALTKLVALRYTPADAAFLLKVYKAAITPPTLPQVLEASKADVVKAVKMGLITPENGYVMLIRLGFTAAAATFILSLVAERSPTSPMSYEEFYDVTQSWRQASGLEAKPMTDEIKRLGAEVTRLTREVEALQRRIQGEQRTLVTIEGVPEAATARLTELQGALHRAQAELARVQVDYRAKVAEWRHAAS